jgi:hypothetical protein
MAQIDLAAISEAEHMHNTHLKTSSSMTFMQKLVRPVSMLSGGVFFNSRRGYVG